MKTLNFKNGILSVDAGVVLLGTSALLIENINVDSKNSEYI